MSARNEGMGVLVALGFTSVSWILGALASLLPLHEYSWASEPDLREVANPNAVLVISLLCGLGIAAALGSLAVTRQLAGRPWLRKGLMGAAVVAAALCAYRLVTALPYYSG